jgi:hypothetical protein
MVVLPTNSQEANHFALARMMHRGIPHAFVILALLLMDERSNSVKSLNMSRIWVLIRTRSKSFQKDLGNALGLLHPN